jgi:hypothetical protein
MTVPMVAQYLLSVHSQLQKLSFCTVCREKPEAGTEYVLPKREHEMYSSLNQFAF